MRENNLFIVIGGPTGVGKSRIALKIGEIIGGEIINADSRQIYKDFDIGTGKPSKEEREKIPHHLFDIINGDEKFSAYQFMNLASEKIIEIIKRKRYPIIVGGTGLYIRALLRGLFPEITGDQSIRDRIKKEGETKGWGRLFERLKEIDPEYAEKISPNDKIRIVRALEVYYKSGKPISFHFSKNYSPVKDLKSIKIFINENRKKLYRKIEKRVDKMFELGLIEEVKRHLDKGYKEDCSAFNSIGYIHVAKYLKGEISREKAISEMKKETRHYAKRQLVWFKKEKGFRHFNAEDEEKIIEYVKEEINWKSVY